MRPPCTRQGAHTWRGGGGKVREEEKEPPRWVPGCVPLGEGHAPGLGIENV